MRGSMGSCSLCNRKSHMFAVRSEKYTCLQIAAGNLAVHAYSREPGCACLRREAMQINDGRTDDMDQEVA